MHFYIPLRGHLYSPPCHVLCDPVMPGLSLFISTGHSAIWCIATMMLLNIGLSAQVFARMCRLYIQCLDTLLRSRLKDP